MIKYVLSVFFYESEPRAGLWVGDDLLTLCVDRAKPYSAWTDVVTDLKKLRSKYPHSHWQPLEIVVKEPWHPLDSIVKEVMKRRTPEQEVQQQIDHSQDPGIRFSTWYHQCPNARMDNVLMARDFVCLCGARATDHDLGTSTGTAGGTA